MKKITKWLFILFATCVSTQSGRTSEEPTDNDIREQRNAILRNIYRDPVNGERFVDYLNMMIEHLKADDKKGSLVATQGAYKLLLKGWLQPEGFADFATNIIGQIWKVRDRVFQNIPETVNLVKSSPFHFKTLATRHDQFIKTTRDQLKTASPTVNPEALKPFYKYMAIVSMQRDMAHVIHELKNQPQYEHPWNLAVVAFAELQSYIGQVQNSQMQMAALPFEVDNTLRYHMLADNLPMPQLLTAMLNPAPITTNEQMAEWLEKFEQNGRTLAQLRDQTRLALAEQDARLIRRFLYLQQPLATLFKAYEINNIVDKYTFSATSAFISALMEYLPANNKDAFENKLDAMRLIYTDIAFAEDFSEIKDFPNDLKTLENIILSYKSQIKEQQESPDLLSTEPALNATQLKKTGGQLVKLNREMYIITLYHNLLWFTHDVFHHQAEFGSNAYILGNIAIEELKPFISNPDASFIMLTVAQQKAFLEDTLYNPFSPLMCKQE